MNDESNGEKIKCVIRIRPPATNDMERGKIEI